MVITRFRKNLVALVNDLATPIRSVSKYKHSFSKMSNEPPNLVSEGLAKAEAPSTVFYNPVQEYNRDLTIAIITEHAKSHFLKESSKGKKIENGNTTGVETLSDADELVPGTYYENGIKIYEGLAASGLRSMRFGLEIPGVKEIVCNDYSRVAVDFIERNIQRNNLSHIVKSRHGDAAMGMLERKGFKDRFDVIDLDPYGSPHAFLDSAVQAVADGGLLCITCTDAAVLCGNAPEKCNSNYGAVSLRAPFQHEMALRIILQCLDSHANRYSRYIQPLLSLSIDFYFRVFVRVHTGQKFVKHSMTKKAMVFNCTGCGAHALQPTAHAVPTKGEGNYKFMAGLGPTVGQQCPHCDHQYRMGGPIWSHPIHDVEFVHKIIKNVTDSPRPPATKARICGMLSLAAEELQEIPLYYELDSLCQTLHCSLPRMTVIRSAFFNAGYKVSLSHAKKNSYKTDAPIDFIWDVMKEWIKTNPVNEKRMAEDPIMRKILQTPQKYKISFEEHPDADPVSRKLHLKRFQMNPLPNWGPKTKAPKLENSIEKEVMETDANGSGEKS